MVGDKAVMEGDKVVMGAGGSSLSRENSAWFRPQLPMDFHKSMETGLRCII